MEDASETYVLLSFVGQVRSSVDENLGTLASFMRRLVHSNCNEMIQCDYHEQIQFSIEWYTCIADEMVDHVVLQYYRPLEQVDCPHQP
jgi:hypothetical protein